MPSPSAGPARRSTGFSACHRSPGKTKTVDSCRDREKIAFGTCTSESTWTSWRARGRRRPPQRSSRRRRRGPRRCTGRGSPAARPARTPPRRASRSRRARPSPARLAASRGTAGRSGWRPRGCRPGRGAATRPSPPATGPPCRPSRSRPAPPPPRSRLAAASSALRRRPCQSRPRQSARWRWSRAGRRGRAGC